MPAIPSPKKARATRRWTRWVFCLPFSQSATTSFPEVDPPDRRCAPGRRILPRTVCGWPLLLTSTLSSDRTRPWSLTSYRPSYPGTERQDSLRVASTASPSLFRSDEWVRGHWVFHHLVASFDFTRLDTLLHLDFDCDAAYFVNLRESFCGIESDHLTVIGDEDSRDCVKDCSGELVDVRSLDCRRS